MSTPMTMQLDDERAAQVDVEPPPPPPKPPKRPWAGRPRTFPKVAVGDRIRCYEVIALLPIPYRGRSNERVRARCVCGFVKDVNVFQLRRAPEYCTHAHRKQPAKVVLPIVEEEPWTPAPLEPRPKTEQLGRISKVARAAAAKEYEEILAELGDYERPKTRGECSEGERPCPFVSCKHHLALDVKYRSIVINRPSIPIEDMTESCALDVADRGGVTLERCAEILNITRERIRQIEAKGLEKMQKRLHARDRIAVWKR
jgi:hypothetical protein